MPDLFTHALVAYVIGTLLSMRYDWLSKPYVTIVMLGAFLPDLTKIKLVIPSEAVEYVLGISFDWVAIHTPVGSLVAATIGALLVTDGYRKRVFALLVIGALSHHALDAQLLTATRYSYALLWPLSNYHFSTPGLYLSYDRWPAVVASIVAVLVWYADQRYVRNTD